jgi:hypothetical protein
MKGKLNNGNVRCAKTTRCILKDTNEEKSL